MQEHTDVGGAPKFDYNFEMGMQKETGGDSGQEPYY
jgi:hypothetical protein